MPHSFMQDSCPEVLPGVVRLFKKVESLVFRIKNFAIKGNNQAVMFVICYPVPPLVQFSQEP